MLDTDAHLDAQHARDEREKRRNDEAYQAAHARAVDTVESHRLRAIEEVNEAKALYAMRMGVAGYVAQLPGAQDVLDALETMGEE